MITHFSDILSIIINCLHKYGVKAMPPKIIFFSFQNLRFVEGTINIARQCCSYYIIKLSTTQGRPERQNLGGGGGLIHNLPTKKKNFLSSLDNYRLHA